MVDLSEPLFEFEKLDSRVSSWEDKVLYYQYKERVPYRYYKYERLLFHARFVIFGSNKVGSVFPMVILSDFRMVHAPWGSIETTTITKTHLTFLGVILTKVTY